MPIYTFYPQMADGSSLTFDAVELDDDAAAIGHCQLVLAELRSAVEVVVWDGERRVYGTPRRRAPRALPASEGEPADEDGAGGDEAGA